MAIIPDKDIGKVPVPPEPESFKIPAPIDVKGLFLRAAELVQSKQALQQKSLNDLNDMLLGYAKLQETKRESESRMAIATELMKLRVAQEGGLTPKSAATIEATKALTEQRKSQVPLNVAKVNEILQRTGPYRKLNLQELEAFGAPQGATVGGVQGQVPVSQMRREKINEFAQAVPILDSLESQINSVGLAKDIPTSAIIGPKLYGESLSPATNAGIYKNSLGVFLTQLSRAAGERGVVTDKDVERIAAGLPGFFDTEESKNIKFNNIRDILTKIQAKAEGALRGPLGSNMKSNGTPTGTTATFNSLLEDLLK